MSDMPQQEGWRRHLDDKGREVEARLGALQERRRLAMHRFEEVDDISLYPVDVMLELRANERLLAHGTPHDLSKDKLHLVSMSLLPAPASQKAMFPFDNNYDGDRLMYLMNLDTEKPQPPQVVRAFRKSTNTGHRSQGGGKNLKLWFSNGIPELDRLYEPYVHAKEDGARWQCEEALVKAVFADKRLSALQLDALGRMYEAHPRPERVSCNEVIVAATPKDIEALAVPVMRRNDRQDVKMLHSTAQLTGALAGLAHIRQGMDLPVMIYHLDAPHMGRFTYLAQGKEECTQLAVKAMHDLQGNPHMKWHEANDQPGITNVRDYAKDELGIDLFVLLKEQGITIPEKGKSA